MKHKNKKILFTGGHAASTAYVLIKEIKKQKKLWEIYWVGAGKSLEGDKTETLSSLYFPGYGVKTFTIMSGRIQTRFSRQTIPSLLKIPVGFFHAVYILLKIRPDVIFSLGGFSAFPVVIIGYLFRIPIIIHEQTSVVGRTNKFSSRFATKIAISRESSFKYFPDKKTILTGNPIPEEIIGVKYTVDKSDLPLIFITGGQSGSVSINNAVCEALPKLLTKYKIVHLTGTKQESKFTNIFENFNEKLKNNYTVYGIVDLNLYNKLFSTADLIISRAGANTVSKIIAAKKPAILIPLPISYLDEQSKNAEFAENFGIAIILKQSDLTPDKLIQEIDFLTRDKKKILEKVRNKKSPDADASRHLVELIESLV